MKKLNILLTTAMLLSLSTFAQKKTWLIDVNGNYDRQIFTPSYSYVSTPPVALTSWSASVLAGKAISEHFTVGLHLGYGTYDKIYDYEYMYGPNGPISIRQSITANQTINLGLFGRYTYWLSKRIFVYSQLTADLYGVGDHSTGRDVPPTVYIASQNHDQVPIESGAFINLIPAVGINIYKGWGAHVDAGGISYTYADMFFSTSYQRININFAQQFHLGFHKIIGWQKATAKTDAPKS